MYLYLPIYLIGKLVSIPEKTCIQQYFIRIWKRCLVFEKAFSFYHKLCLNIVAIVQQVGCWFFKLKARVHHPGQALKRSIKKYIFLRKTLRVNKPAMEKCPKYLSSKSTLNYKSRLSRIKLKHQNMSQAVTETEVLVVYSFNVFIF